MSIRDAVLPVLVIGVSGAGVVAVELFVDVSLEVVEVVVSLLSLQEISRRIKAKPGNNFFIFLVLPRCGKKYASVPFGRCYTLMADELHLVGERAGITKMFETVSPKRAVKENSFAAILFMNKKGFEYLPK